MAVAAIVGELRVSAQQLSLESCRVYFWLLRRSLMYSASPRYVRFDDPIQPLRQKKTSIPTATSDIMAIAPT